MSSMSLAPSWFLGESFESLKIPQSSRALESSYREEVARLAAHRYQTFEGSITREISSRQLHFRAFEPLFERAGIGLNPSQLFAVAALGFGRVLTNRPLIVRLEDDGSWDQRDWYTNPSAQYRVNSFKVPMRYAFTRAELPVKTEGMRDQNERNFVYLPFVALDRTFTEIAERMCRSDDVNAGRAAVGVLKHFDHSFSLFGHDVIHHMVYPLTTPEAYGSFVPMGALVSRCGFDKARRAAWYGFIHPNFKLSGEREVSPIEALSVSMHACAWHHLFERNAPIQKYLISSARRFIHDVDECVRFATEEGAPSKTTGRIGRFLLAFGFAPWHQALGLERPLIKDAMAAALSKAEGLGDFDSVMRDVLSTGFPITEGPVTQDLTIRCEQALALYAELLASSPLLHSDELSRRAGLYVDSVESPLVRAQLGDLSKVVEGFRI